MSCLRPDAGYRRIDMSWKHDVREELNIINIREEIEEIRRNVYDML
jgi:hypothetical protein